MPDEDDDEDRYGFHYGRNDIYRTGFFDDTPPGPFDKYLNRLTTEQLRDGADKGAQMSCSRRGGFFDKRFKRIFTGEALPELGLGPKKKKKTPEPKRFGEIIHPPGWPKSHSSPGDWFGCIGKQPKHFSPELKESEDSQPKQREPPNFAIKPPARGGPGYLNICLNPYVPMHLGKEPYDRDIDYTPTDTRRRFISMIRARPFFDENPYRPMYEDPSKSKREPRWRPPVKKETFHTVFPSAPYGPYSGCFWPFPRYLSDPYKADKGKKSKKGELPKAPIRPCGGPETRSKYTCSAIDRITHVSCNATNYVEYRPRVYSL
ncbi:hypothetical protein QAD02_001014 [Eretmocerus hayati]|uniref:Uncharacterized protein n=1 Tax=Eretmocerus hayati TaxID=131215 RepID=A0ACC2NF17_9HYME|nr:hypothetical protein QAD02_001014 [Eretmocerus hayati]